VTAVVKEGRILGENETEGALVMEHLGKAKGCRSKYAWSFI